MDRITDIDKANLQPDRHIAASIPMAGVLQKELRRCQNGQLNWAEANLARYEGWAEVD